MYHGSGSSKGKLSLAPENTKFLEYESTGATATGSQKWTIVQTNNAISAGSRITITLPSSTGTLALQSETPGASVAPGAALVSNTANTLE